MAMRGCSYAEVVLLMCVGADETSIRGRVRQYQAVSHRQHQFHHIL